MAPSLWRNSHLKKLPHICCSLSSSWKIDPQISWMDNISRYLQFFSEKGFRKRRKCMKQMKPLIFVLFSHIEKFLRWVSLYEWQESCMEQVWRFPVFHFQLSSTDRTDILCFLYTMISLDTPDVWSYLELLFFWKVIISWKWLIAKYFVALSSYKCLLSTIRRHKSLLTE